MPEPDPVAIRRFLQAHFEPGATGVHQIGAGMFSRAYAFVAARQAYVLRLNAWQEDLQKDAFAARHFSAPGLPIPPVLALGRFDEGRYYAITARCPGQNLDQMGADPVRPVVPRLFDTLAVIHSTDVSAHESWGLAGAAGGGRFQSWREALQSFLNLKFEQTWRDLAQHTFLEADLYAAWLREMERLLPYCPEDKHLVHGDFGFDNVISDGRQITGVLDWAEYGLGDFVYDVAYLDFWSKEIPYGALWHEQATSQGRAVLHYEERMRCYMLHIGLEGMRIAAAQGNEREYIRVRERTRSVLSPDRRSPTDWTQ
jgi:hygromycin-B 4-O-kinase